ncbi:hypothetical protein [Burkholderia sp. Ac-20365]|uniref:hypothetical protein n=1 Tax=Burkholderia sp. Ac-20365 TaxID=2703897 RepID=UPI00197BA4CF|nr:hypothetical protein [Burkholderia sp. Ac-20365]MBN3761234.1 hypothetical protein [Burkholderia sp. Ac-20365]
MKNALFLCLLAAGLSQTNWAFADMNNDVVCLREGTTSAPLSDGSCVPGASKIDAKAWRESGDKVVVRKNGAGILLEPASFDQRYTYLLVQDGGGTGAVKISTRAECDKLVARNNGRCMTAAEAKAEFVRLRSAD